MGNPKKYLSPDVTVDFTSINLEDKNNNTVSVSNVKGMAPTDTLKLLLIIFQATKPMEVNCYCSICKTES